MSKELQALRTAAKAELDELEREQPPAQSDEPSRVDELLEAFFADVPPTDAFVAALEALAEATTWIDAPAGRAASSASQTVRRTGVDVGGALRVSRREAKAAIAQALNVSSDAADLLLGRPAASLLRFEPGAVQTLADLCSQPRGSVFAAIAASAEESARDYVYPYRPGLASDLPARRVAETLGATPLLEWGYRFFGLSEA